MPNGGEKPGDAIADKTRDEFDKNRKERELAIERLKIRAEMRSENFEEDSVVIHKVAEQRVAVPAPSGVDITGAAGGVRTVLDGADSWPKVVALMVLCAALAFAAWLRWGH